ncbi:MAG: hypothetical protein J6W71_06745, partial [Methanobrevibacter sp.]|nr:hypothetical protein [Methanobrevibacter sp.]
IPTEGKCVIPTKGLYKLNTYEALRHHNVIREASHLIWGYAEQISGYAARSSNSIIDYSTSCLGFNFSHSAFISGQSRYNVIPSTIVDDDEKDWIMSTGYEGKVGNVTFDYGNMRIIADDPDVFPTYIQDLEHVDMLRRASPGQSQSFFNETKRFCISACVLYVNPRLLHDRKSPLEKYIMSRILPAIRTTNAQGFSRVNFLGDECVVPVKVRFEQPPYLIRLHNPEEVITNVNTIYDFIDADEMVNLLHL